MFVELIQGTNIQAVLPLSILLFCTYVVFSKSKKNKKMIPEEVKNNRILIYRPEPMIDYSKIDTRNNSLDKHVPKATDTCLNLGKINYLNLLNNKNLQKEAESCIREYGVGSCGPRGFYGTIDVHLLLESRLAEFMGLEESVIYSYGFSTISSAIAAYCKKSDIIFCDEKVSFPTGQGILAARSKGVYFKHNDMEDLELKLKEYEKKEKQSKRLFRKFLIVEGIYSATGTICPLPKLMELREKYKLRIFIDESVSFGVLGKTGRGVTEHFNIDRKNVDMIMGSLEHSLGSIGGFCVGASVVIEHQRLSGLGYCFSASLPPFLSHISVLALDFMENNPNIFDNLKSVAKIVDEKLRNLKGYEVISDPISPLKVFTIKEMNNRIEHIKKIHAVCKEKDIHMLCVDETLNFNVNVALNESDIDRIVDALKTAIAD